MLFSTLLYILSFIVIWLGAGFIVQSVDRISRRLGISSFAVSFFILGILTSIPEAAISATAIADGIPEIFVGNLLGGVIVIFLFIIPMLAVLGKGIKINHDLSQGNIFLTLLVIALPGLLVIDKKVTNLEGIFLILAYMVLFFFVQKKHGLFDKRSVKLMKIKAYSFTDLIKVLVGVALVFVSSQYIVNQTILFSHILEIPAYFISLLVLALGTNLPELSLAIRAVVSGKKDIAFGDYLGSASANTLLFGIFTIANDGEVLTVNNFYMTFAFILLGLILFYFFSKSRKDISKSEGSILLGVYTLFIALELVKGVILR